MSDRGSPLSSTRISRRRALALAGSVAGGLALAGSPLWESTRGVLADSRLSSYDSDDSGYFSPSTVKQMEAIMQTTGTQSNGVLSFELEREDLKGYTIGGHTIPQVVPFSPAWENNGDFYFQNLSDDPDSPSSQRAIVAENSGPNGCAILNGDFGGLLPQETNPFIDQLLAHRLVFEAFHMHFTDIHPQELYFIHFRGVGDPLALARGVMAAVKVTGTPLPQPAPSHPTTPLPARELGQILGGPASVGSDGVVTVLVPRRGEIVLNGVDINPFLNVATNVVFEPLNSSGSEAAVGADFSMVASETQRVVTVMRQQGWVTGCLYNQETDEEPQLFFSHQLKVGDPVQLAHEARRGLDQTNSVGS